MRKNLYYILGIAILAVLLFGCKKEPREIAVDSIELSEFSINLHVGESQTLSASIKPDNATNKTVTWASSDASIATVANGVVIANGIGSAIIVVVAGDKTAMCGVTVTTTPVSGITLDKTTASLKVNENLVLTATISPSNATDKTVTWSSSDTSVAVVINGVVIAGNPGITTISAKAGDKIATCVVTVIGNPVTGITLDKSSASMKVNETITLYATVSPDDATDKTVIWQTSDESVATVSNGVVAAVNVGMATITAKAGDVTASCSIIVEPIPVTGITLDKTNVSLKLYEAIALTATVSPSDATDNTIVWSTSDSNIATVNNGYVTALKIGTATISAMAGDKTAACVVTVKANDDFPGSDKYKWRVKARYFGNKYSSNTDNYVLYFYLGEYNEDDNFIDVGTEATFDMLCPVTDGMQLSAGTYKCTSNNVSPYHFLDGVIEDDNVYPSFFYRQYGSGQSGIDLITDGSMKISGSGDNYSIETTFKVGTNNYHLHYTGSIEFIDETSGDSDEVPKDVKMEKISRATVENLGSIWSDNSGTLPVDDWVITLYGKKDYGKWEYVTIELLSEKNAKSLPTGKFVDFVNVSSATASEFKSRRIIAGYADGNTPYGTWYCKGGTAWYAALEGTLNIEENGGVYTIDFAFTDTDKTYGGSFSGKYSGNLDTVTSSSSTSLKPMGVTAPTFRSALTNRTYSGVVRHVSGLKHPKRNPDVLRKLQ